MRKQWIDTWKGLLILLVVMGHVVGSAEHLADGGWVTFFENSYALIYLFHMPAFFFLAGFMWHDTGDFKPFLSKKFMRLVVPYIVFGIASALLFLLLGQSAHAQAVAASGDSYYSDIKINAWWTPFVSLLHAGAWPNGEGFRCNSVLWFLPCMFLVHLAQYGVGRLKTWWNGSYFIVLVTTFIGAVLLQRFRIHYLPLGLNLVPFYLLFVFGGHFAAAYKLEEFFRNQKPVIALSVAISAFVVLGVLVVSGIYGAWRKYLLLRVPITSIAIIASMALAMIIHGRMAKWVGALGAASLGIMLMHKFVVVALQVQFAPVRNMFRANGILPLVTTIIVTVVATAASYFATIIIRRYVPWAIGERWKLKFNVEVEDSRK